MTDQHQIEADHLRSFIERYEHLEAEKHDITDQQKDVLAEAKGWGYDTVILREIIKLRKMNTDERAEKEAILEMYLTALGMD